jgi:hypothetical protein
MEKKEDIEVRKQRLLRSRQKLFSRYSDLDKKNRLLPE